MRSRPSTWYISSIAHLVRSGGPVALANPGTCLACDMLGELHLPVASLRHGVGLSPRAAGEFRNLVVSPKESRHVLLTSAPSVAFAVVAPVRDDQVTYFH